MQGRIARFRRRLFPGGNPLTRFGDRVEAALLLLLVVGALLTLPFAAAVGSDTYAAQTARAEQERTTRHPATATSLAAAATQTYSTDGAAPADQTTVPAAWFDARGTRHTGDVLADSGSPKGTHVPVWLDQRGELTTEPLSCGHLGGRRRVRGDPALGRRHRRTGRALRPRPVRPGPPPRRGVGPGLGASPPRQPVLSVRHFQRKCTKTRPKLSLSFSIRW